MINLTGNGVESRSTLISISQTDIGHFVTITRRNIDKLTPLKRMKTGRITALVQQEIAFLSYAALI